MTEIVKFVYAMIIFFKLFLVATNNDGKPLFIPFKFPSLLCK